MLTCYANINIKSDGDHDNKRSHYDLMRVVVMETSFSPDLADRSGFRGRHVADVTVAHLETQTGETETGETQTGETDR